MARPPRAPVLPPAPHWTALVAITLAVTTPAWADDRDRSQPAETATDAGDADAPQPTSPAPDPNAPTQPAPASSPVQVDGQARSYVMSTINRGAPEDYAQWALGGQLGGQTASLYGFSLGARFYAALGVAGNSQVVDTVSGLPSRYESGLFDFTDRQQKELIVLGEAYADFRAAGHHLWAGRHRLKTPMLNGQDGRMIPTLFEGAWYQNTSLSGLALDLGYISHVYARSGPRWMRVEDAIGIYPQGRSLDGTPADYHGQLHSAGIFVGGVSYQHARFHVSAWDYALENILNVVYTDAFITPELDGMQLSFGAQYLGGQRLANGGNPDPAHAYMQDDAYHVFGAKAELRTPSDLLLAVNYDRVTRHGRFVFPRELGVEPLFVFMKRERTEGAGDVHGASLLVEQSWSPGGLIKRMSSGASYGVSFRTDPREADLNKNGFPSLYQINWDTFIHFGAPFEGLVAELLLVYKGPLADTYGNARFVVNKVDMFHADVILNYNF